MRKPATSSSSLKTRLARIEAKIAADQPPVQTERQQAQSARRYLRSLAVGYGDGPADVAAVDQMTDQEILAAFGTDAARRARLNAVYEEVDDDDDDE